MVGLADDRHLGKSSVDDAFKDYEVVSKSPAYVLATQDVALKKGQQYMTVVMDYLTGRVVWTGEGRDKETLDGFFAGMTDEQKAAIEAEEVRKAVGPMKRVVKGSRYLLLKNRQNLRPDQGDRLDELLRVNANLNAVYALKDQLKVIYHYKRRHAAKAALDEWCAMAARVNNHWMSRFIKTLRRFEYGILNHCDFSIGTSPLEGTNNKIKVIKRKAYGFHDPVYFGLKIKQAFPGNDHERKTTNCFG